MPCEHQLLRTPPLRHDLPAGRVGSAGTNVHGGQVKEPTLPGGTASCEEQAPFGGALCPVHRLLVRVIRRVSGEYFLGAPRAKYKYSYMIGMKVKCRHETAGGRASGRNTIFAINSRRINGRPSLPFLTLAVSAAVSRRLFATGLTTESRI